MSDVAIIVISYNMGKMLKDCINSLLNQSITDFRLIIIDDASSDGTEDIVKGFTDKRINHKKNNKHLGIAASRNAGIAELKNEKIVFFIDADCYANSNWLKEGLNAFISDSSVLAVEGATTYGGNNYHPRLSEKFYHMDCKPGLFQTHNCAYKIEVFQQIGGFDEENFNYSNEDVDFFYRAKKEFPGKKFLVCPNMKVVHQVSYWNITKFFKDTYKAKYIIRFIKKHGRLDFGSGMLGSFILSPNNLILGLFPPLIFIYILKKHIKISNLYDLLFILLYIIKAYHYRFMVWYYALKEKIFVI